MSQLQVLTALGPSALAWKAATVTVFLQHHFILMGHFLMSSGAVAVASHTPGADKCSWHSLKINLLWIVRLLQCLTAGSPFSPSKLNWLFNRDQISPQQIHVLSCALNLFYNWLCDLLPLANQQLKCQFVLSFLQTYINRTLWATVKAAEQKTSGRDLQSPAVTVGHWALKALIHYAFHLFLWRNQCVKRCLNKKLCFMLKREEIPVSLLVCHPGSAWQMHSSLKTSLLIVSSRCQSSSAHVGM